MPAERLTDGVAVHGEGPVWWPAWGGLRWVDMLAGDVLTLDPKTGAVGRTHLGDVASVIRPRSSGGAIVARAHDVVVVDKQWGEPTVVASFALAAGVRLNEGGCDPDGRFYCGSHSPADQPGSAGLYRIDHDGTTRTELADVGVANGLGFAPDGRTAYFVDTSARRVDAFEYTALGLSGRRPWLSFDADDGAPDGLCVDASGGVWVAVYGAGQVRRYDAHGVLDSVVEVPVANVTACTFGGPDLNLLFITTSALRHRPDDRDVAGALYLTEPGVVGLPALAYRG
jgi:sugar lactone lactonase YvrE